MGYILSNFDSCSLLIAVFYVMCLNIKSVFSGMGIPMLKIRRLQDNLIFNMGFPILVRRHLHIETVNPLIPSFQMSRSNSAEMVFYLYGELIVT